MAKRKKKKLRLKKRITLFLVITVLVITAAVLAGNEINKLIMASKLNEKHLTISYDNIDETKYKVNITYDDLDGVECSIDNNEFKPMNECTFELPVGKYTIYIKKDESLLKKDFEVKSKYDGYFRTTLDNVETYYLALGGSKELEFTFNYPEGYDTTRTYEIDDDSIINMENDTIKGLKNGTTTLHVKMKDGYTRDYNIMVTDIISPPTLNNNKEYLPCMRYNQEEADLLDKILESRVQEAGYGTRGAVVAVARFINLEFKYQMKYFNENGRLNDHGIRPHVDGEGRFFHKGMYLQTDKYSVLEKGASDTGPKPWGCEIYDRFISRMNKNGFDCSGFVTWAMYNGGFIYHDSGAGEFKQFDDDLSDLGPHHEITDEYMKNGHYQVGDFIARDGHAALIIGISDDTIYTAESLPPKLKIYIYGRYTGITKHGGTWKSLVNDDNLTYVVEMDDIYPNGAGWFHNMW
jgi:hypothetical protein